MRKPLPLWSLKPKSTNAAIEMEEDWLKIAVAEEKGGRRVVTHLHAEPIKDLTDLEISQKIKDFFKKVPKKIQRLFIAHPVYNLTTRILTLPSTDPEEIKGMVQLQAVKQTPYTREEIATGFHILGQDSSGYSQVLLSISHRDTVSRYVRIVELAGLSYERVSLCLQGIENWLKQMQNQGKISREGVMALVVLDSQTTDFLVVDADKLVFNRSVGIGAAQLSQQAGDAEGELLKEIQRSVESSRLELKGKALSRIYLSGIERPLTSLSALFARELNLPCEIIPPFQGLDSVIRPEVQESVENLSVSFLSLSGLILEPDAAPVNLVPPELQVRKNLEERGKDLAHLGTLLLIFFALISLISFEQITKKTSYLNQLKREYESIRVPAESAERIMAKMKLVQEQLEAEGSFLEVLKEIQGVLPRNATVNTLEFHGAEKTITLRGMADEMSTVFQMLPALEATPHLDSVKTKNVAKRKMGDKDVAEFEISAHLSTPVL